MQGRIMDKHAMDGNTVYLRPMTVDDTDKIINWRNQDFVRNNFIYQEPFTREGHLSWIKNHVETGKAEQFIICLSGGREIGSVYFRDIDRETKTAEYGIFIGEKDAIGCGYGSEAARLMLVHAFKDMQLQKVFLRFMENNTGARRSYENAGFKLIEGRQETVRVRQGECKILFMETDASEWREKWENRKS